MSRVRVESIGVSVDGFAAGPRQDLQNPLGVRGPELMAWLFATDVFAAMHGKPKGEEGVDNDVARHGFENVGAWILGRNMFGPVRGPWPDENWKGWWGEEPPYHVPVFVLTHHARAPIPMKGGTTFHFVTDGIVSALEHAKAAAHGKDVRIGGGTATIRQYLRARLVDEMRVALRPVVFGEGEALWAGLDLPGLGYEFAQFVQGERAMHLTVRRRSA
jgi:dihydrofolate reductase